MNEKQIDELLNHVTDNCDVLAKTAELNKLNQSSQKLLKSLEKLMDEMENEEYQDSYAEFSDMEEVEDLDDFEEDDLMQVLNELVEDGLLKIVSVDGEIMFKKA